ncbi:MAG: PTS-dependent dihydroxyacetone kinase phosphotransferase subunit DhaM [Okeania sp. SIO3B3]|nr:PTS-dependent dihydroxyacetone kinase phosphotransferase subunit DhaM [Okeania sp. SIO3B3]
MVSIVIVSHSRKLAEGVLELADQMVQGQVQMAVAGGIDDPENPIGTDPMKVYEAIESVYSDDGVLVVMDLGSALLSAEMALEFLSPGQQARVRLCAAPLVEGVMAAAVQASTGAPLSQVLIEAQEALTVKINQL